MAYEYRLTSDDPVMGYDYTQDVMHYFVSMVEPSPEIRRNNLTEHSVRLDWSEFAKSAFQEEQPESSTPVWSGHLEQFGMVMLNLAKLSRYRKAHAHRWSALHDTLIDKEVWRMIYEGPSGSEEREFYRSWFSIIGHKDFCFPKVGGIWDTQRAFTEAALVLSYEDMRDRLRAGTRV